MLRRTKILIAGYCVGGLCVLGLALSLVLQFIAGYKDLEHHDHHHADETPRIETSPAETYAVGSKTYMKVAFQDEDFDVTQSCVDLRQILEVNLDLNKFPDLRELPFVSAEEIVRLPEEDAVIGISIEGEEKAYPIRMLNYHGVLNDICAGKEIAVVWDPLSMTPKVFGRKLEGNEESNPLLTFGKLALLHKGGLLLYDEQTRSIWWPPEAKCLAGKLSGASLTEHPFVLASWKVWKERHPKTSVLSTETPFAHMYPRNRWQTYYAMPKLPFPVEGWDARKSPLKWNEPVIALETEGKAKAYPLSVLGKIEGTVEDTFGGRKIVIHQPDPPPPFPTDEKGREVPYSFGAWFLWSARYPNIEIYSPQTAAE